MNQEDIQNFVQSHTALMSVPFVPELKMLQAEKMLRVWRDLEKQRGEPDVDVPYWAFVWSGGQALARYIFDNSELVKGKNVLDMASGSGVSAIAAHKAGAATVVACDIDPLAQTSVMLNAAYNEVEIEVVGQVDMAKPPKDIDLIIAGDICYEQVMSQRLLRWLMICREAGIDVIVADPKRGYAPDRNPDVSVTALSIYTVPTLLEIEDGDTRDVILWQMDRYSVA